MENFSNNTQLRMFVKKFIDDKLNYQYSAWHIEM